jgi:hypothetical protein
MILKINRCGTSRIVPHAMPSGNRNLREIFVLRTRRAEAF